MSDKFVNETMSTIRVIKEYKEKHGNTIEISGIIKLLAHIKG